MTMHLAHPALNLTGHRKGRQKWASAEAKKQHEELTQSWNKNMEQWKSMSRPAIFKPAPRSAESLRPKYPPGREPKQTIPSVDSGHRGAVSSPQNPQYTGDSVVGIAIMHKSCLQPVFSQEAAIESARMRRG